MQHHSRIDDIRPILKLSGCCLLMQKYFCAVYDYAGKADLSKGYWNPKRKLGVTTHFSEIIEGLWARMSSKEVYCSIKSGGRFCPEHFNYTTRFLKSAIIQSNVWHFFLN